MRFKNLPSIGNTVVTLLLTSLLLAVSPAGPVNAFDKSQLPADSRTCLEKSGFDFKIEIINSTDDKSIMQVKSCGFTLKSANELFAQISRSGQGQGNGQGNGTTQSPNQQPIQIEPLTGSGGDWPNCASGFRNDDCVELLEYFDVKNNSWKPAVVSKTANYIYEEKEFMRKYEIVNGISDQACGAPSPFYPDVCYTITGILKDGNDAVIHTQVGVRNGSLGIIAWVDKGDVLINPSTSLPVSRDDGWIARGIPSGTKWRLTLKSESVSKNADWVAGTVTNPLLTISKGGDGVGRLTLEGATEKFFSFGTNFKPEMCDGNISKAQSFNAGFWFFVRRYEYSTAGAIGLSPGGIAVGTNGIECGGSVQFDPSQGVITVRVGGPHYEFDGKTENKGWLEASIRGDVVRKAFKVEPQFSSNFVKIEVEYSDGSTGVATHTSRYISTTDTIEIRAYDFHYSAPKLKLRLANPQTSPSPQASPASAQPSIAAPAKKPSNINPTITCAKGKATKKVSGSNPKCPKGYRKV